MNNRDQELTPVQAKAIEDASARHPIQTKIRDLPSRRLLIEKFADGELKENELTKVSGLAARTLMIMSGTSYDFYVPVKLKQYKPIVSGHYATQIGLDGEYYYRLHDFLRTPDLDGLPAFSEKRLRGFRLLDKIAQKIQFEAMLSVFPELSKYGKVPSLWIDEDHPTDSFKVNITIPLECTK